MQRDVEKIEELYRAHDRRDLKSVLLLMAPEVEVIQSEELPWGGHYHGHDGVRQFLAALTQHVDSRVLIERLIDAGDRVVAIGRTVGKTRARQLEFDIPVVHVWTFSEGRIIRFEPYIENHTLLAALGM
jgi:ketosteroid isomerase-like protein